MSRRISPWRKAAALAPVLLLLVYLPGQTMLRCRIDGLLRPTCCCPQGDADEPTGPVVKAQDCCDPEVAQSDRPPAVASRPSDHGAAPEAAVAIDFVPALAVTPPTEALRRAAQRHGPAREGPPIVLLKRAFLI
jgi:hypothetical protein